MVVGNFGDVVGNGFVGYIGNVGNVVENRFVGCIENVGNVVENGVCWMYIIRCRCADSVNTSPIIIWLP